MSSIFSRQTVNERELLTYGYESVQDIDDIIIQLINESADRGFLRGTIDMRSSRLIYETEGLVPLAEYLSGSHGIGLFLRICKDLSDKMHFLEDSFIDTEYVDLDMEDIFVNTRTDRLTLAILPISGVLGGGGRLRHLLRQILDQLCGPDDDLAEKTGQKIASISEDIPGIGELIDFIEAGGKDPDSLPAQQKTYAAFAADPAVIREEIPEETENKSEDTVSAGEDDPDEEKTIEAGEPEKAEEVPVPEAAPMPEAPQEENTPAFLLRRKTGEIIPLLSSPFIIGKVPLACDYVVSSNPTLSRIHAFIRYDAGSSTYYIVDCSSTNHIYLDGTRIEDSEPVPLKDKMKIHLATEEFIFNC